MVNFILIYVILKPGFFTSIFISAGYSLFITALTSYIYIKNVENLLGILYYFAESVYENRQNLEESVFYSPMYEELQEIISYIERSIKSVKSSLGQQLTEVNIEYSEVIRKLAQIMEAVESLKQGKIEYTNLPAGLDPAGALGELLRDSLKELSEKIDNIKRKVYELDDTIKRMINYAEAGEKELVKAEITRGKSILEEIEKELEFFK